MKWIIKRIALTGIIILAIVLSCTNAFAQQRWPSVTASLKFDEYDVVYLTDFVDVRSQQLNPNISGISFNIFADAPVWVYVYTEIWVQLRGESNDWLVKAYTNNFKVSGSRTLAAKDFAKGGKSDVCLSDASDGYYENATLRKKLEDLASKNPTAPAGKYTINMKVVEDASNGSDSKKTPSAGAHVYCSESQTVVVSFSSSDEAFVEINDPKDGSYSDNLAPTFTWTTGSPRVIVRVFEAGINHRSPQDALTGGNPHLVRELTSGVTTLTYPQDAARQLQENKAYVLQVEARVSTNRGEMGKFSRPVVFRITDDKIGKILDNYMNTLKGSASSTYSSLRSDPTNWLYWSPFGNITLNGSMVSESDLQTILNELAGQTDLNVELRVENQ